MSFEIPTEVVERIRRENPNGGIAKMRALVDYAAPFLQDGEEIKDWQRIKDGILYCVTGPRG